MVVMEVANDSVLIRMKPNNVTAAILMPTSVIMVCILSSDDGLSSSSLLSLLLRLVPTNSGCMLYHNSLESTVVYCQHSAEEMNDAVPVSIARRCYIAVIEPRPFVSLHDKYVLRYY